MRLQASNHTQLDEAISRQEARPARRDTATIRPRCQAQEGFARLCVSHLPQAADGNEYAHHESAHDRDYDHGRDRYYDHGRGHRAHGHGYARVRDDPAHTALTSPAEPHASASRTN